jgi:hypothetical protein
MVAFGPAAVAGCGTKTNPKENTAVNTIFFQ